MTDDEYFKNISSISNEELIDNLEDIGHDMYYDRIWKATIKEIKRRLDSVVCNQKDDCDTKEDDPGEDLKFTLCSDKLPDNTDDYLVWYENEYKEEYDLPDVGIETFDSNYRKFGYLNNDWVEIPVVAWMPLPKPYKG